MVRKLHYYLVAFSLLTAIVARSQQHKFGFSAYLEKSPNTITTFCVPNNLPTKQLLQREGIDVKYSTKNWLFISTTAKWIDAKTTSKELSNYYFEFAPPTALADSVRAAHYINPVFDGTGLSTSYTGENVIIGYVDQGLDWKHPDFKLPNGKTRVLRYWDHTLNSGGTIPQPYNYGIVWDSAAINSNLCISTETGTAHGTTVAGIGSGNAGANGKERGVAPKSNIIIVESNFNLANWTLSIADACDYIFKVADSLGMPAVVNLSLGTYLGSHDARDPAGEYIDSLLTAKSGRIVVCAAGNSGAKGKYHVRSSITSDTSFVWIKNNTSSSGAFGANKIYFDLWSDASAATFKYAFAADAPAPSYGLRGKTPFRLAQSSINTPVFDTIKNASGKRIATMGIYTELVNGNYHMEVLFDNVDSTNYVFRFMTTGSGSYDMWSGSFLGLNDFVTTLPSASVLPAIVHYNMPDSLQTLVSSWSCSNKVITVGNVRNRLGHITKNNVQYYPVGDLTTPGKLSVASSKGPTRLNAIKPDVSAGGDVSLSAAPLWLLNNSSFNSVIDIDGWHARNGGTSMASPVVAGIAALYLQKCGKATYQTFKNDLTATAYTDNFTGVVPNNSYGYGKPHALNLMLLNEFTATVVGEDSVCTFSPLALQSTSPLTNATWSNGATGLTNPISAAGSYSALALNAKGCVAKTDTLKVVKLQVVSISPIVLSGNVLSTLSPTNYQWTLNGVDIPGATDSTYTVIPPGGTYTCYCFSADGCKSETAPFQLILGIDEQLSTAVNVFPNPTSDRFTIQHEGGELTSIQLVDCTGKEVTVNKVDPSTYSIAHLARGMYYLSFINQKEKIVVKITRK